MDKTELRELELFLKDCYEDLKDDLSGKVADYIPYLSQISPSKFAISLCTIDGEVINIGDFADPFCLQSCSKPFSYCYARKLHGRKKVHSHVGYEPTGVSFSKNVLNKNGLPHNPMVNAGAIMIHYLLHSNELPSDRFNKVKTMFEEVCGDQKVGFNTSVFLSEKEHADNNYALAYSMRGAGAFGKPMPSTSKLNRMLDLYFQICSIEINAKQGAIMAATLANGGICPTTYKQLFDTETVRDCISLMFTCGMYDFSGEFAFDVGLPAKSGVSGSIFLVVPGKFGLCIWSPALDTIGNSVRGIEVCRRLSKTCCGNYHIFRHIGQLGDDESFEIKDNVDFTFYIFMTAIKKKDMKTIMKYIENIDVSLRDWDGRTFLHIACSEGHVEIIKLLLDKNALLSTDRWGNTPMDDIKRFISEIKDKESEETNNLIQKLTGILTEQQE